MWCLEPLEEFLKTQKKWPKKYRRELTAVLDNLDTFFTALRGGQHPAQARFGFIHPEPNGVLAIDQRGAGQGAKETRLYIYPDADNKILYVITLGDKDSQPDDIAFSKRVTSELREESGKAVPAPHSLQSRVASHGKE